MSTSDRLAGPEPGPDQRSAGSVEGPRADRCTSNGPIGDPAAAPPIVLSVPATTESLRLVRLLASGVAADAGLDIESVEDVRIATDELANAAIAAASPGAVLTVRFAAEDELRVEGSVACRAGASVELEPLAGQIVRAVASSHSIEGDDVEVRFLVTFALPSAEPS